MFRFCLVGFGRWGKVYFETINRLGFCTLDCIVLNMQKEQDNKLYSEEYMLNFAWFLKENLGQYSCDRTAHFEGKYLEQFKNK